MIALYALAVNGYMFYFMGCFTEKEIIEIESEIRKNIVNMNAPLSHRDWKALIKKVSMEMNIEIIPIEISQIIRT